MLLKRLIIVGYPQGNLAGAIYKYALDKVPKVTLHSGSLKSLQVDNNWGTVVIYAGKGGRYSETRAMCSLFRLPLIQASTGQETATDPHFPFINTPNLALPIIAFFKGLTAFWAAYAPIKDELRVEVKESHQSSKKSVPGTAKKIAGILGYTLTPEDSERDRKKQYFELSIPEQHLDRHAYHNIKIAGLGVGIELRTLVLGLDTYAQGTLWLCEKILAEGDKLTDGIHEAEEFLK